MKKAMIFVLCLSVMLCTSCEEKKVSTEKIDLSSYPVKTDVELTYWCTLPINTSATTPNLGDTPLAKALEEATGIHISYLHPSLGQESESFSLMIASNELPDMIEYNWIFASGGPAGYINDGTIVPINRLIDEYAPNLREYLIENPDVDKTLRTDDGSYYGFPFIRGDKTLLLSAGPIIRRDWLEDLGLSMPRTLEEWETVLTRFKNEKGATAPLTTLPNNQHILFAFTGSCYDGFYIDNGKVRFSPAEPAFRRSVELLADWCKKGLLDKNFSLNSREIIDYSILTGKSGAFMGSGGSSLGRYLEATTDDRFDLVGTPYPEISGESAKYVPVSWPFSQVAVAITSSCKYPELAAKFLDYGYSTAGHMLYNFGIEGVSYNVNNSYPAYTEIILNNPDSLPINQAMGLYTRSHASGPFVQDKRYLEQYYSKPQQKEALANWLQSYDTSAPHIVPPITLSAEESYEYNNIMSEIFSKRDEYVTSFILGILPLSQYDDFVSSLYSLGLDRAIELEQAAYDRFLNR